MFEELLNNKDFAKYLKTFSRGDYVFLEGDETQDLYVLISGHVEIIKGTQKIKEITEQGAVFGELSFLLGAKRTKHNRGFGIALR